MSKKIGVLFFILMSVGFLFSADRALAFPKVYSPIIQKGEIEIEAEGLYTFDERQDKGGAQSQKYAVGYGVTDRWATEVYGEWENNPKEGKSLEFRNVELENRVQLFEQGQYWLDAGLYFSYEFASENKDPDKIEAKILLEKQLGNFVHTANLILEREVGGETPEGKEKTKHEWAGGVAWSSRYRWRQYFEPGVEIHYDAKELNESHSFNEQELQVGPVLYGKIGPIKYDVGYLFGISEAAPDGQLKWIVEFEWHF